MVTGETVGKVEQWRVRVAVVLLLAAPSVAVVACYSTDGLVGPGPREDASPPADTFVPAPDTSPPPTDAGTDAHADADADAEDATPLQPFDAACGVPAFEDTFDDSVTGLNLWSPDFTAGIGNYVVPGKGGAGGAAELGIAADTIGYAQLGYSQALTDRTVIRFFFHLVDSRTTVNIFEAINGPNFRVVVEGPANDATTAPERTITAYVPGNAPQRWVNIKVTDWHELQIVLDRRQTDGGLFLVAQMTLDDMFVRSFPTRFATPELPAFYLTARRVVSHPMPSTVRFDDARFWACTNAD